MKKSLIIPLVVLLAVSMACSFTSKGEPTPVPEIPTVEMAAPPPTPEIPTEEPIEIPTIEYAEPPTLEPVSMFFRDEFDYEDLLANGWSYEWVTGNSQNDAEISTLDGRLVIKISPRDENVVKLYRESAVYTDVVVQAEVENKGDSRNGASVLCRVNENGFYEFRISSGGQYWIYRYDQKLKKESKNPYVFIAEGGSQFIHTGTKKNAFSMVCIGNDFRYFINNEELKPKIPLTLKAEYAVYPEGGVGLGAFAYRESNQDVELHFEYFETLEQ
jgi:hypothetical protein